MEASRAAAAGSRPLLRLTNEGGSSTLGRAAAAVPGLDAAAFSSGAGAAAAGGGGGGGGSGGVSGVAKGTTATGALTYGRLQRLFQRQHPVAVVVVAEAPGGERGGAAAAASSPRRPARTAFEFVRRLVLEVVDAALDAADTALLLRLGRRFAV